MALTKEEREKLEEMSTVLDESPWRHPQTRFMLGAEALDRIRSEAMLTECGQYLARKDHDAIVESRIAEAVKRERERLSVFVKGLQYRRPDGNYEYAFNSACELLGEQILNPTESEDA